VKLQDSIGDISAQPAGRSLGPMFFHVAVEGVPVAEHLAAVEAIVGGGRQVDGLDVALHVAALLGGVAAAQTSPDTAGILFHVAFPI
jgi:hypothetical protein